MKKTLSAIAALGMLATLPAIASAGGNDDEIMRELELLRNKMAAQMERIEYLEGQIDKKVEEAVEKNGSSKVVLANKFIDQLTLKGDLRVRYERRDKDLKGGGGEARDRWRTRFRVGGVWENMAEDWQVGAGLATGSGDPTSTNDTWSETEAFETGDIRLDYAYAKHKLPNTMSFTLGQHKNPYEASWVMWDSDVRFAGFTGKYGEKSGPFVTLGGYGAKLVDGNNTAMLYAGQIGYNGKVGDAKYIIAAGYHAYDSTFINDVNTDDELNLGNIDPEQYDINVGDIYGKVSFPAGPAKLSLYGQLWQNFGADGDAGESQEANFTTQKPEDYDTGWVLGLDAKINQFKLGYAYAVVEADSLYGVLKDGDFGDGISSNGTNVKGHRVKLGYSFSKNWSAGLTWLNFEEDEEVSPTGDSDSIDTYQFDIKYKF